MKRGRIIGGGCPSFQRLYCGCATPTQPSPIEGEGSAWRHGPDLTKKIVIAIERPHTSGVRTAPITDKEAHTALAAVSRYGKGRGHPARLNLGDCFA
jgi:hypothetical protein